MGFLPESSFYILTSLAHVVTQIGLFPFNLTTASHSKTFGSPSVSFHFHCNLLLLLARRGENHKHVPALIHDWLLNDTSFANLFQKLIQQGASHVLVGHHPSVKHYLDLYLVSVIQNRRAFLNLNW